MIESNTKTLASSEEGSAAIFIHSHPGEEEWGQPPACFYIFDVRNNVMTGQLIANIYTSSSLITVETDQTQAWFWTPEWQAGEREVERDLQTGQYEDFDSLDGFLETL